MNIEQKTFLRERLGRLERDVSRALDGYTLSGRERQDPPRIRALQTMINRLDRRIRLLRNAIRKKNEGKFRPVWRAVEIAKQEIVFGDAKKALALVDRADKIFKKAKRS